MKQVNYTKKDLEFNNFEDISFPTICLVCGKETESRLKKSFYGNTYDPYSEKRNHFFTLPICSNCQESMVKDKKDERKSKHKIIGFSIIGIALSILNYFLTFSIVFSIIIFALLFIIPFANFRSKFKSKYKIELENYLTIDISNYGRLIKLHFKNQDYAKYVKDLNGNVAMPDYSEKDDEKDTQKVKSLTNLLQESKPIKIEQEKKEDFEWDSFDTFKDDREQSKPIESDLTEIPKDIFDDNPFKTQNQKLCKACGAFNDDDSAFCVKCGDKLT